MFYNKKMEKIMTYEELNTRINKIDYDFKVLRGSL